MSADPMTIGIIGAGPGGLALGILLTRAGFHDFTIFDREDDVGGTWRINTYPGLIFMLQKTFVAVRASAMAEFVDKAECSNYFRAPSGRMVTQCPRSARSFWGMTRRFKPADFTFASSDVQRGRRRGHDAGQAESMTELDGFERLHPALRAIATTRTDFSPASIQLMREPFNERRRVAAEQTQAQGVQIVDNTVATESGKVPVRIYRGGKPPAPPVVYCHAGGFALGNLDTDHRQCVELARRGRCTVVSVDYRLAPEHPYPAALEDAIAVLRWVGANATQLRVDVARLAVAGSSAGATLAACLAHGVAGVAPVVFQLLHQPVLDDRATASKAEFQTSPAFDSEAADLMWRYYLGPEAASGEAVPARRDRFDRLPPALITCAEIDPFRDEAVDYALRLLRAGVSTELHVFAQTCHGFDSLLPDWSTSERLFTLQGQALRRVWYAN